MSGEEDEKGRRRKEVRKKRFSCRTGGAGQRRVGLVRVMTMMLGIVRRGRGKGSCLAGEGFVEVVLVVARNTPRYPLRAGARLRTVYLEDPCVA